MRRVLCALGVVTLAASTSLPAAAAPSVAHGAPTMCVGGRGTTVWQPAGSQRTIMKGSPGYGKGHGRLVCRGPMRASTNAMSNQRSLTGTRRGTAIAPRPAGTSAPGFAPASGGTRMRTGTSGVAPRPAGTNAPGMAPTNAGGTGTSGSSGTSGVAPQPAGTNAPGMPPAGGNATPSPQI